MVDTIEVDAPLIQAGDAKLLHDIHLRFEKGGKYRITGPSGCGKTTLIRTLKGTIPSAYVRLNDRSGKSMKERFV
ncbi:ATP-binding cassette domain-containing protein [Erysipelotrichaceae bacterium 66-17]